MFNISFTKVEQNSYDCTLHNIFFPSFNKANFPINRS